MDSAKIFSLCKLAVVLLMMFVGVRITNAEAPADTAWWENETLIATGYGLSSFNANNAAQARVFARKAAITDAYRALAEQAGEIRITANEKVTTTEVRAVIRGAKILSEEYDQYNGVYSVVMSVPIYGVSNSIAKAAFKRVDREDFPTPDVEDETVEGNYTGLIIDCGDLELNPVLSPVVRNEEEQSIYSYSNLDYDKVISDGMVSFVRMPEDEVTAVDENMLLLGADGADNLSRAGNNPLVVKVTGLDADNTCPVLSTADANKILLENQASHFLDGGSVVFMSKRIRGFLA